MTYVGSKRQILEWLTFCIKERINERGAPNSTYDLGDLTIGGYNTFPMGEELIKSYNVRSINLNDKNIIIASFLHHYIKKLERGENTPLPLLEHLTKENGDHIKYEFINNQNFFIDEEMAFTLFWCAFIQTFNGKYWGSFVDLSTPYNYNLVKQRGEKVQEEIKSLYETCENYNVKINVYCESIKNIEINECNIPQIIYIDPPYLMSQKYNEEFYSDFYPQEVSDFFGNLNIPYYSVFVSEANISLAEFAKHYTDPSLFDCRLLHETYVTKSSFNKKRAMYERLFEIGHNDG